MADLTKYFVDIWCNDYSKNRQSWRNFADEMRSKQKHVLQVDTRINMATGWQQLGELCRSWIYLTKTVYCFPYSLTDHSTISNMQYCTLCLHYDLPTMIGKRSLVWSLTSNLIPQRAMIGSPLSHDNTKKTRQSPHSRLCTHLITK